MGNRFGGNRNRQTELLDNYLIRRSLEADVDEREDVINSVPNELLDQTFIAAQSRDRTVKIFSTETGELNFLLTGHPGSQITSIAFSPDNSKVATCGYDSCIKIWEIGVVEPIVECTHQKRVSSVAFDSNGTRIVSRSSDNTIVVWGIPSGDALLTIHQHYSNGCPIFFCNLDDRIISSVPGDSHTTQDVGIWSATTGEILNRLKGHGELIFQLAKSPTTNLIASASRSLLDQVKVIIWDLDSGTQLHSITRNLVCNLSFSFDGSKFLLSTSERSVVLIDALSFAIVAEHMGIADLSWAVLSCDGSRFACGCRNRIYLHDSGTGSVIRSFGNVATVPLVFANIPSTGHHLLK